MHYKEKKETGVSYVVFGVKNVEGAIFGGVQSQWCGVRSRYVGFGAAM